MPTYTISGPDGKKYSIDGPPGATREQIIGKIQERLGKPPAAAAPQSHGLLDTAIDAARSIPGGLAQGFAAFGGMGADAREAIASHLPQGVHDAITTVGRVLPPTLGGGTTTDENNAALSAATGGYYKPRTTVGRVAETAASYVPAAVGGEGTLATRLLGRAVAPAVGTVAGGDITKALGGNEQLGQLAGTVAGGIAGAHDPRKLAGLLKSVQIPTVAELKNAARAAYQTVDNSGMVIDKKALASSVDDLTTKLANMGIHPDLQPNAMAALNVLKNASTQNQTLQGLEVLRRVVGGAIDKAGSATGSKADKAFARIIQDHLDDFVENIGPSHVLGGATDPKALAALQNARSLWSRAAKADQIQGIIDKATLHSQTSQAVPLAAAIRNGFKKLLMNDRGIARFTPEEQAAIRQVATGGPIENIARVIGKLSPDHLVPMLGTMGAVAAGTGPGALAVPAVGIVGRLTSNALTSRNARLAKELMLRGRTPPVAKTSTLQAIGNISPEKLAAFLMTPAIANTRQGVQ